MLRRLLEGGTFNISAQKNAACNLFGDGVISRAAFNQINTVILLLAVCRPTVGPHLSLQHNEKCRLLAVCRPIFGRRSTNCWPTVNSRPTVGRLLADSWPTASCGNCSSLLPKDLHGNEHWRFKPLIDLD